MKSLNLLSLFLIASLSPAAMAHGHSSTHNVSPHYSAHSSISHSSVSYSSVTHGDHHNKNYVEGVPRDSHGRIVRSPEARRDFERGNPCPSTGKSSGKCPGYVIDHIEPLKRGGEDAPSNMQWQTVEDAKAKDKWE